MVPTSHFVGVKLRSELLSDLFSDVQIELGSDASCVEFQNPLSAHVTVFYLPAVLADSDFVKVRELIRNFKDFPVTFDGFEYFWSQAFPKLCFLRPDSKDPAFIRLNGTFSEAFPYHSGSIEDNLLPFRPHATFFKIRNHDAFVSHRSEIESILTDFIANHSVCDFFESACLFKVNSRFRPEIQIAV